MYYVRYVYSRTKNIYTEDDQEMLFLFASLTKVTFQTLNTNIRKRVIPVKAKSMELLTNEAPEYTEIIPMGTVIKNVSKYEFEELLSKCDDDPQTLFCFALNVKPT